jgi:hypothetical protein
MLVDIGLHGSGDGLLCGEVFVAPVSDHEPLQPFRLSMRFGKRGQRTKPGKRAESKTLTKKSTTTKSPIHEAFIPSRDEILLNSLVLEEDRFPNSSVLHGASEIQGFLGSLRSLGMTFSLG